MPANYLALLLLPGSPGPAGRAVLRASGVRWPGPTSQRGWYLVDPSGSHLVHKTQTSAGALVGLWQTSAPSGTEKGEGREPGGREDWSGLSGGVYETPCDGGGFILSSQSPDLPPHPTPKEGEGKREDAFSWGFLGKPEGGSVAAFPALRCFLQLFLFSPVGYYFLTHFDNYFINQER